MEVHSDFAELLACFNARGVEYLIVGTYALAFHGAPRYTGGLDLLVSPAPENARRILAALTQLGFPALGLAPEGFDAPDLLIQLGDAPTRADIMTAISGVSWHEAWHNRAECHYDGVHLRFLGREQYIKNRRAAGRAKDLADVEALGELD